MNSGNVMRRKLVALCGHCEGSIGRPSRSIARYIEYGLIGETLVVVEGYARISGQTPSFSTYYDVSYEE